MYIRTTKRRNTDGSEVRYYQLAENVWDPERRCAIAKVLYNFGRADALDGDALKRLARSILRVVDPDAGELPIVESVGDGTPVTLRHSWPYGAVFALDKLWKELGIDTTLTACAREQRPL